MELDRKFDNKKTPYYYDSVSKSYIWFWWRGKNNIIEEIYTYSDKEGRRVTYTQKNSIQYNSSDMPIKIDGYTTYSDTTYTTHTTTTYEYIEAK